MPLPPHADHDRPLPELRGAVVGRVEDLRILQRVPEIEKGALQIGELAGRIEPLDVLDDEDARLHQFDDLEILFPEPVSRIVRIALAESGKALTGRAPRITSACRPLDLTTSTQSAMSPRKKW